MKYYVEISVKQDGNPIVFATNTYEFENQDAAMEVAFAACEMVGEESVSGMLNEETE